MEKIKQHEKIGFALVLITLGAATGMLLNTYAGGNTIRYDVPLNIGDSIEECNQAIDAVLKNPDVKALADAKPSRVLATQKFMVSGEAVEVNGTITSSWFDFVISPPDANGVFTLQGVNSVIVVTILYEDKSGYYLVYDSETGSMSEPVFSQNVLES